MSRKEEIEVLIPASKYKCADISRLDTFQRGLHNIEEVEKLKEEVEYLYKLMQEYDELTKP